MKLKKAYYYFYYKLYKFWNLLSIRKSGGETGAAISITLLELFIFISLNHYYEDFIDKNSHFGARTTDVIIIFLAIPVPNYIIFLYKDRWKAIVKRYDNSPPQKNKIGGIIVGAIALIITAHFLLVLFVL